MGLSDALRHPVRMLVCIDMVRQIHTVIRRITSIRSVDVAKSNQQCTMRLVVTYDVASGSNPRI